jgi:hypothetical protein
MTIETEGMERVQISRSGGNWSWGIPVSVIEPVLSIPVGGLS